MSLPKLNLSRDLTKHLKQGNPWIFKDALFKPLPNETSPLAHLFYKNEFQGLGLYDPKINLVFRLISHQKKNFTQHDLELRLKEAFHLRQHFYHQHHNSCRLVNGEGDQLPGLILDYYNGVVVLKTDGEAAEKFWLSFDWSTLPTLMPFPLKLLYLKHREGTAKAQILWQAPDTKIDLLQHPILENGIHFRVNIQDGAKTGFFLDQRDARLLIKQFAQNRRVLNLFSYTGGFSVAAGLGSATEVTSVDIAPAAIESARLQWEVNDLPSAKHHAVCTDAFLWADQAIEQKKRFDLIITDPPSFAPNAKSVDAALKAYIEIFAKSLRLLEKGGLMAFSSCSSHITFDHMEQIIQESLSKTRKVGKVLKILGQPEDHPHYFAHQEGRYLKFFLLQVD